MTSGAPAGFMDDVENECWDPTDWDLAMAIRLGVEPETDRAALDELADAMLVWADDEAEQLTPAAVERLWDDELEAEIRGGLERVAGLDDDWRRAALRALAELDEHGREAPIVQTVVQELAAQLSQRDHPPFFCTCCIDEGLSHIPPELRRARALEVAIVARRNAAIPRVEVAAALAGAVNEPPAVRLGTRERRVAVRERLGRIGSLAATSMPNLAAELRSIGDEPLSERAADDDVWAVVCEALLADVARPELN